MRLKCRIYLKEFEEEIIRKVNVDSNITLKDFCEYVIISMNGTAKSPYKLIKDKKQVCVKSEFGLLSKEEKANDLKLSHLDLKVQDILILEYNSRTNWEFSILIEEIKDTSFSKEFEVISGSGNGIIEDIANKDFLRRYLNLTMEEQTKMFYSALYDGFKKYRNTKFSTDDINAKIEKFSA